MIIHLEDGNPVIATVLMSLIASEDLLLVASVESILLGFETEEAAQEFVAEAKSLGCHYSKAEFSSVSVVPDFGGSKHAAQAIYRAVDAYRNRLVSVNDFQLSPVSEPENILLKEIEQYIKKFFGSDAMTIVIPVES